MKKKDRRERLRRNSTCTERNGSREGSQFFSTTLRFLAQTLSLLFPIISRRRIIQVKRQARHPKLYMNTLVHMHSYGGTRVGKNRDAGRHQAHRQERPDGCTYSSSSPRQRGQREAPVEGEASLQARRWGEVFPRLLRSSASCFLRTASIYSYYSYLCLCGC